jgi:hypothetical protein
MSVDKKVFTDDQKNMLHVYLVAYCYAGEEKEGFGRAFLETDIPINCRKRVEEIEDKINEVIEGKVLVTGYQLIETKREE